MKHGTKKLCICAVLLALCVLLPIAFHSLGLGAAFSPLHLPVLLCGLVCGPVYGAVCGLIGPILASILTGMPPAPKLLSMIPELIAYGTVCGILMRVIRTKTTPLDLYLSLIPAMLAGRIIGGIVKALISISNAGSYSIAIWAGAYFSGTLPAIIVQLILLPLIYLALEKARLLEPRYSGNRQGEKTC